MATFASLSVGQIKSQPDSGVGNLTPPQLEVTVEFHGKGNRYREK